MSAPRYARLVASMLGQGRSSIPAPAPASELRLQTITAVQRAITERARKRRIRRWAVGLGAVAAVFVASFGVSRHLPHQTVPLASVEPSNRASVQIVAHPVGDGASVVVSGAQAPLAEGRALAVGSRVVTPPTGRAMLAFSTGTSVTLREGADLTVGGEGASQLLRLETGTLDLHVAKLAPGQRFIVDTPDAEVEVRGTQFAVSIARPDRSCGDGTLTRVAVVEGVVLVRHAGAEARVVAGQLWPSGCGRAESNAAPVAAAGVRAPAATPLATGGRAAAVQSTSSTLGEQNDMFAEAVAAKRRGDTRGALAGFDRFLSLYPSSPLAESAAVERLRVLRAVDPMRTVSVAKQYLALYPNGFAHGEAEAIVAGAP